MTFNLQALFAHTSDLANQAKHAVAVSYETASLTWDAVDEINKAAVKKQQQEAIAALLAAKK